MIRVRPMTVADIALGLRLSEEAGWNQIAADWQRFLALQPDGCFVAESDGAAVGTTTTCIFGSVAWIAMVLVAVAARGRGIGTALMRHALAFLDERGIPTVRLDARPMGQPLYERLGFVEQYRIDHYEGTLPLIPSEVRGQRSEVRGRKSEVRGQEPKEDVRTSDLRPLTSDFWERLMTFDGQSTRTDRRRLLARLFTEDPRSVRFIHLGRHVGGYLISRPGRKTVRLGPCIAAKTAGPLLLADAWNRYGGQRVSLDVPAGNEAARQWIEAHGLTVQHTLTRMCRGVPVCEQVESLWASSGPEKG
jgi:GNAT superfamily N-acetyltransferase